ncbi:MAG: RluA family pseudouridine synthase, partial [Clostridia bacterium]|nr:RluA family pseudouridine synthase [Clostridia bacterium]
MNILFEDKHLIFAVKPKGVLSQSGEGENMIDLLSEGRGEIFPIHRLDKSVSGVMVFAKTKAAAGKLSAMVQNNEIKKEYLAVVCGKPQEESAVLEDLLFKDSSKNKSFVVKRMRKGVKKASLEYETMGTVIDEGKELSLLKILLHTGRTHQIRVQFSSRKLPLLGDGRYGGK